MLVTYYLHSVLISKEFSVTGGSAGIILRDPRDNHILTKR